MKRMILVLVKKYKEVISYVFFGVLTTVLNIIIYFLFTKIFVVNYLISNVIAWVVSVAFAFITNKLFVFDSIKMDVQTFMKEGVSFMGFRLLSGAMDMILMYIGVEWLFISDGIMKIVSNILVIVVNYIASKLFVFKKKGESVL